MRRDRGVRIYCYEKGEEKALFSRDWRDLGDGRFDYTLWINPEAEDIAEMEMHADTVTEDAFRWAVAWARTVVAGSARPVQESSSWSWSVYGNGDSEAYDCTYDIDQGTGYRLLITFTEEEIPGQKVPPMSAALPPPDVIIDLPSPECIALPLPKICRPLRRAA